MGQLYVNSFGHWELSLTNGNRDCRFAHAADQLGHFLHHSGLFKAAEPLFRRALEGLLRISATMARAHPNLNTCVGNYAGLLRKMGQSEDQIKSRLSEILRPFGMSLGG